MSRNNDELNGVTLLGNQNTKYDYDYNPGVLETFVNKHPDNDYIVTFDAYEFTSLCVTGDTLIETARDESQYPLGIPIKDLVGTTGYVFGFDINSETPVCRKYYDVRKTQENAPIVKITLDCIKRDKKSGDSIKHETSYLRCTPNHLILVKTGFHKYEWIQAKDLQPDMHLVYSQSTNSDYIRNMNKYRLIACATYNKSLDDIKDLDVHHKDHNHRNNSPNNLELKEKNRHRSEHQAERYGYNTLLNTNELIKLYNSGVNIHQLSQIYKCDDSTIKNRLEGKVEFRTQAESLRINSEKINMQRNIEICNFYQQGYTTDEIADYFDIHSTTVLNILRSHNIIIREANHSRALRKSTLLPALNHKVISVENDGFEDVYNMEVEDVHNFFANDVIIHNCPKTGQPDFAKVIINYIPNQLMVESKSLKLYLFSFRNHGDFHEDCMNIVMKDLINLMDPKYIEVKGIFAPRGGISIYPFVNWANPNFEYNEFVKQRQLENMKDTCNRTNRYDL